MAWRLLKPPLKMTTRPIAMLLLGSLLWSLPASADRRTKRRVAQETEEAPPEDQDGPEATSVLAIKLDDLIEVAVRLAPELARSKNDRLAAKGEAQATRRDQQWVVTASSQYSRFAVSPDVEVGPFGTVGEDKLSANLGIGRNLPTGGNVSFQIGIQRTIKELEIPALLADQVGAQIPAEVDGGNVVFDTYATVQSTAKLVIKQPLVRGFGRDVALAQEKKGDLAATEATVKTQLAAEEMLREVVTAYWELAYASYEVDTRAESLDLARKQEEMTRVEIRAKTAADSALTAVLYEVQIREEALLTAKNQWEKKSLELRKRAGLELTRRDLVMRPQDPFEPADDEWEIADVLARARKSNRRMASLILQKRSADIDIKVAKNSMLPKVDLELSGALVGTGDSTDRSLTAAANSNGYEIMAGLTVQFDIGGAAKGAHDAALARRQRVEVDQADTTRTLDTEVVHAVHEVKSARARLGFADKAIQYAVDNVKAERAAFQSKLRTNFDVMQRQTELVNARLRRGRAIADYHLAVANVQFLGGFLLEQYRVNVRPLAKSR
ncbi:MAG: TolC family protein [Deltaproteobacteria bacterium]|nr:TolC family protein [Deltaproteobacteria bacterium]